MSTFDPNKITFFAKTDARGQDIPFGIKAKDRQRHMYVVGKTGMGKSTLLENMAAQDIQNGEGMAFIDPHGSAAEALLEYVPEHRVKDVVYFAPFDLNHPIAFNVMEDVGPDKRHLVVSGLMSTFKKIWVDAWSARMEYILTNALLALIEYPDTTLLSVNRLFVDKAYRKQVIDYIQDPAVKAFWTDEFANYTDRFAAEALPAIQNKIGQFTGNPLIRNIIGQPHSSFDIRDIMDNKKILIMNLSKGLIGETNANLLGSMLTTRIYLAAMSRADLSIDVMQTMPNFYFYVDEFQSFANATFANILSEARKYHLNLIIAHQYIEQMEEDVRNAVFGNVGTTVAFRVGPFDAEVLETVFSPRFLAPDLVNLGFAQIYLTLMIDGIGSQPFSAQTLPPIERPPTSCRNMVITASRKLYANERESVEETVARLHNPVKPEPSATKRPDTRRSESASSGRPSAPTSASASTPRSPAYRTESRGAEKSSTAPVTPIPPTPVPPLSVSSTPTSGPSPSSSTVSTRTPTPTPTQTPPTTVPADKHEISAMRSPDPQSVPKSPSESPVIATPTDRTVQAPPVRSTNTPYVRPPRPPERSELKRRPFKPSSSPSLDDLRAVLAQVSRKDESKKAEPADALQTHQSSAQMPSRASKPHERVAATPPTPPRTALDLKSALAALVEDVRQAPTTDPSPATRPTPHIAAPAIPKADVPPTRSTPAVPTSAPQTKKSPPISLQPDAIPTVDIARVKQLLRSPRKERNPFA